MPRNGSGVYSPPSGTTVTPNTVIESVPYNASIDDVADALTDSINVDGTAPWQANQPMGSHKFTGLGAGSAATDSLTLAQAQADIIAHAASVAGTVDAITATFSPVFTAYTAKMRFRFTAAGANTVTAPTINVDGLGVKTIKKLNSQALRAGDIAGSGHVCDCVYDGTDAILLNPALISAAGTNTFTATQTFTGTMVNNGPTVHGQTTLTDQATVAWDLSTGGPDYKLTLGGDRTLDAYSGSTAGQEGFLTIAQDGTGGRSLDLSNAVYDFYGGLIENIARGVSDETVYHYRVISSSSMILKRMGATSIGGSGRELLSAQSASASATIDFVLTKWLTLYDRFEIDIEDLISATNDVELWMRTSTDGGSTYAASAANYKFSNIQLKISGTSTPSDAGAQQMTMVADNGADQSLSNANPCSGTVRLFSPNVSSAKFRATWDLCYIPNDAAGLHIMRSMGVGIRNTAADVDAVRFMTSSGNITSGSFRLYGIRK